MHLTDKELFSGIANRFFETTERKCKLNSGEIVEFDIIHTSKDILVPKFYEYLGEGRIYSVGDIKEFGNEQLHFFRYKTKNKGA